MKKIDTRNNAQKYYFLFILLHADARAGKVDDVQNAVYETCKIEVSSSDALRLVKDLYGTCEKDELVKISASCEVRCLKKNKQANPDPSKNDDGAGRTDPSQKRK